jgi:hypothetical protein
MKPSETSMGAPSVLPDALNFSHSSFLKSLKINMRAK